MSGVGGFERGDRVKHLDHGWVGTVSGEPSDDGTVWCNFDEVGQYGAYHANLKLIERAPPPPHREPIEADREAIAYAIIKGSGGVRAADHAKEFVTANWNDALRSADAVIATLPAAASVEAGAISRSATAKAIAETYIAPGTTAEQLRDFLASAILDDRVVPALTAKGKDQADHALLHRAQVGPVGSLVPARPRSGSPLPPVQEDRNAPAKEATDGE